MDENTQSIYDIADQVGVSASTVSRVLNQRDGIGSDTRKKVLAVARQARFRPRMTARQVTVAVVIDRYQYASSGGFIPILVSNLVQVLSRRSVAVELCTEQSLSRIRKQLVDGVLAMAWDDQTVAELARLEDVPVVALNRLDVPEFSAVATDHYADGVMAVRHFAERGHRRIAMICEEEGNWGSVQRIAGFKAEMAAQGLEVDGRLLSCTEHQPMYGVLRRVLALRPTAIFVANESLGLEAGYILRDVLGVKIPDAISLIAMESAQVSQFQTPPLTTIAQPLDQLADKALELLMKKIDAGPEGKPEQILIGNRLIQRESVATLPPDRIS